MAQEQCDESHVEQRIIVKPAGATSSPEQGALCKFQCRCKGSMS